MPDVLSQLENEIRRRLLEYDKKQKENNKIDNDKILNPIPAVISSCL